MNWKLLWNYLQKSTLRTWMSREGKEMRGKPWQIAYILNDGWWDCVSIDPDGLLSAETVMMLSLRPTAWNAEEPAGRKRWWRGEWGCRSPNSQGRAGRRKAPVQCRSVCVNRYRIFALGEEMDFKRETEGVKGSWFILGVFIIRTANLWL